MDFVRRASYANITAAVLLLTLGLVQASPTDNHMPRALNQKPLIAESQNVRHTSRLVQQNDSLCDTGANQWTGTVNLGLGRDMFFWYHESRNSPESDPLIIWLNGGPGASSLLGGLHEVGPCVVNENGTDTERNPNSWVNLGNMLFIDQPIGVGFSAPEDPTLWATTIQEAAIDFDKFLDGFFELFPNVDGREIHFAGESYGGKYVPSYVVHTRRKFSSLVLVDALIDHFDSLLGYYEHLCLPHPRTVFGAPDRLANATACSGMAEGYALCGKAGDHCRATYDGDACSTAMEVCSKSIGKWLERKPGGLNPYDDRVPCEEPPMCGHLGMEELDVFSNSHRVQRALGFHEVNYTSMSHIFNERWYNHTDNYLPTSREIVQVLDGKDTRILVLNGNNDIVVNSESIKRIYDGLRWSGQAKFLTQQPKTWSFINSEGARTRGGEFKAVGNLALVTVDEAGHMSPKNQPEGCIQILKRWIEKESLEG